MNITKIKHSCILINIHNTNILIDPGSNILDSLDNTIDITNLDIILITHKHEDHLDYNFLNKILEENNNINIKIFTNSEVGLALDKHNITWNKLEDNQEEVINGVSIKGFGTEHIFIHDKIPKLKNTGYLINNELFHPGDSYHVPNIPIKILAAPFGAPWGTIGASLSYVEEIKPKHCFPIHDGLLSTLGPYGYWGKKLLGEKFGFISLKNGEDLNLK